MPEPARLLTFDPEGSYSRYLKGEKWRCQESPVGSHHWQYDERNEGTCKFCGATKNREGEITMSENNGATKIAVKDFAYGLLRKLDERETKNGKGMSQLGVRDVRKMIYTELD